MLHPMQLIRAEPSDLPFILALEGRPEFHALVGAWTREQHEAALADPDMRYLIIAGRAGFVILRGLASAERSIEVKRVIVAEPGQGTGRRVLETVLRLAFGTLAARRVWLDVFEDNARARHLYRSLGFREDGMLPEVARRDGSRKALVLMSLHDRDFAAR